MCEKIILFTVILQWFIEFANIFHINELFILDDLSNACLKLKIGWRFAYAIDLYKKTFISQNFNFCKNLYFHHFKAESYFVNFFSWKIFCLIFNFFLFMTVTKWTNQLPQKLTILIKWALSNLFEPSGRAQRGRAGESSPFSPRQGGCSAGRCQGQGTESLKQLRRKQTIFWEMELTQNWMFCHYY